MIRAHARHNGRLFSPPYTFPTARTRTKLARRLPSHTQYFLDPHVPKLQGVRDAGIALLTHDQAVSRID